jgi:cytochrome P450
VAILSLMSTLPRHRGAPIIGPAIPVRRDILGFITELHERYGDIVGTAIGPPGIRLNAVWVLAPEGAEQMFSASTYANFRKEDGVYAQIRTFFGDGLLTAQDETWTRQKRFVQPLFTAARVNGYVDTMVAQIERSLADLESAGLGRDQAEVDLTEVNTLLTLRVVGKVLFGEDVDLLADAVMEHFPVISEAVIRRGNSPISTPLSWPLPANRRALTSQAALREVCQTIIDKRRADAATGDDLVSRLINARDGVEALTDDEIRDQVFVFLLAGHETTSTTLTFALDLLGRHPDIQDRVRAEVSEVLGDRTPTAEEIHGLLPYTTAVLKETMRLFPSAPLIGRLVMADDVICGHEVPAGHIVVTSPWVIQRRADLWPDPLRFDPDRFLDGHDKGRHRYAWMAFGAGPRACIGQHFAVLESVAALALMVRRFEFTTPASQPDVIPVTAEITLRATVPMMSSVRPVEQVAAQSR